MNRAARTNYPLPFGNAGAVVQTDIRKFSDNMSKVVTSLNVYESALPNHRFASKSHVLHINGLKIAAGANSPVVVDVGHTDDVTLMIPFAGTNYSTFGKNKLIWNPKMGACFLPSMGRGGSSEDRAVVTLTIDPIKLQATMRTMLGNFDEREVWANLLNPRVVSLEVGGVKFLNVFGELCKLIDAAHLNPDLLSLQGMDDMFYRNMALMMQPELFYAAVNNRIGKSKSAVDTVCDYVLANLHSRLTLTDLEKISGLSQRSLHTAFANKFQMSPMQWVKERRLMAANTALLNASPNTTVTQIALDLGFASLGAFAVDYRKRFGESPSATLKNSQ